MNPTRIIVADGETLFREGLAAILERYPIFDLTGEATTGKELLQLLEERPVEMVLMDIRIKNTGGLETLSRIHKLHPKVATVVVSAYRDESHIAGAIELGASAYLFRDCNSRELIETLQTVRKEGCFFSPEVSAIVANHLNEKKHPNDQSRSNLNTRDLQVLDLICEGLSNEQIASRLFLSKRTVEGYKRRLINKTGGKTLTDLVLYGVRNGLILL